MPNKNKILIVINPLSGKKGLSYLNSLSKILVSKQLFHDIYYTVADAITNEKYIKNNLNKYNEVIAIGGDGTLNMLCNALVNTGKALGIIPCGTGNDFCRNIYTKKENYLAVVTGNKSIKIDLGWCNDRYFMNVLGVGFDAMLVKKTAKKNKRAFSSFFYIWYALKYLVFYKEEFMEFKSDGLLKNEITFIAAFANGAYFGNGMKITPHASISDGLLDCCRVGKLNLFNKCMCLAKSFSGKHLLIKNVEYSQSVSFQISSKDHPIEADGEFFGYTPATIRIEKEALILKIP